VYCDVTTPPEWASTGEVSMVDLDLDVVRDRQGNTGIVDQDEFAEHQIRYGYPADVVDRAERAAEELLAAVSTRVEPFGATGPAWLARLLTG
jgi:protein associated with RNAse G/E